MTDLVSSVLWAAIAAFLIYRADRLISRWLDHVTQSATANEIPEVPDDLLALVANESEQWAQDQLLSVIRERYDVLRDWNKVRSAVGIGAIG